MNWQVSLDLSRGWCGLATVRPSRATVIPGMPDTNDTIGTRQGLSCWVGVVSVGMSARHSGWTPPSDANALIHTGP